MDRAGMGVTEGGDRLAVAATAVAAEMGLPGPVRLRTTATAGTFAAGDVVLRVQRGPAVGLVRCHEEAGRAGLAVPAHIDGPFLVGGRTVTAFEFVPGGGEVDHVALGNVLAGLHAATRDGRRRARFKVPGLALSLEPLLSSGRRHVRTVCGPYASLALAAAGDTAADVVHTAESRWGTSVVHGDVHDGNVVWSPAGPVLCDWEACAQGPPVWDLVPTAVSVARFGTDPAVLDRLVAGYGDDPRGEPAFGAMVRLREWLLVAWAAAQATQGGGGPWEQEARLRAASLLDGTEVRWTAG